MERAANIWWVSWLTLSFGLLLAAGFGMAFVPDARPSPHEFPARFGVYAVLAMMVGLPGWVVAMWRMSR